MKRRVRQIALRFAWLGALLWWRVARPVTVGVGVLLLDGERVLLVRHTYRSGWFLPGGGVGRGESLEQAARREADEEAGAKCRELALVGLYVTFGGGKSDHVALFGSETATVSGKHDEEI